MTKLAETYFRLDIKLSDKDALELQSYLQQRASSYAEKLFGQVPEYVVYVEDGTVRVWIGVLGTLFVLITGYGSLRSGVDFIVQDAIKFSERVRADIRRSGISDSEILRFERRLGVPGKIQRLFHRLDRLDQHGHDLSKTEYKREILSVSRSIHSILEKVDNQRDRDLLTETLPEKIQSSLSDRLSKDEPFKTRLVSNFPNRLPRDESVVPPRVAIRPEKSKVVDRKIRLIPIEDDEVTPMLQHHEGALYHFIPGDSGFRFIRAE
ncbi:hypothetical protein ACFL17_04275 [Pseudomonadota bacterium]